MTLLSMSHDQNVFHNILGKNYMFSKIFVSETNGPITFGLGMSQGYGPLLSLFKL